MPNGPGWTFVRDSAAIYAYLDNRAAVLSIDGRRHPESVGALLSSSRSALDQPWQGGGEHAALEPRDLERAVLQVLRASPEGITPMAMWPNPSPRS